MVSSLFYHFRNLPFLRIIKKTRKDRKKKELNCEKERMNRVGTELFPDFVCLLTTFRSSGEVQHAQGTGTILQEPQLLAKLQSFSVAKRTVVNISVWRAFKCIVRAQRCRMTLLSLFPRNKHVIALRLSASRVVNRHTFEILGVKFFSCQLNHTTLTPPC